MSSASSSTSSTSTSSLLYPALISSVIENCITHPIDVIKIHKQTNVPFTYNFKTLYAIMEIDPTTGSDCEVIIHLYRQFGIVQTLQMLDGVFSFFLCDLRTTTMYVARDPYGVRPLYSLHNPSKYFSASSAAIQPVPAEVTACL
mgnify:CR=1 FL=1